jgi:hypothetical protein
VGIESYKGLTDKQLVDGVRYKAMKAAAVCGFQRQVGDFDAMEKRNQASGPEMVEIGRTVKDITEGSPLPV